MKTAKNTPTKHCPEKPTPIQDPPPPPRLSQLLSIFASHSLPYTTFPSSLTLISQTRAHPPAHKHAVIRTQTSAEGISPMEQLAEVQVVPGWLLSLCLAQHSPLPAQRPHPILPELPQLTQRKNWLNTLTTLPHHASKRKN